VSNTITAQDVREAGNLISLDDLTTILGSTEPLNTVPFDTGKDVKFRINTDWNVNIESKSGDEAVNAFVSVGDKEVQLSKDALLEATSRCGMPKKWVERYPAQYIEGPLNWHMHQSGEGELHYQVLQAGPDQLGVAVIRQTLRPFSNLRLVDEAVQGIRSHYGSDTEVMADPHLYHSLRRSDFKLVVPGDSRIIESKRNTDDNPDKWCAGLDFHNSLIGEDQTAITGHMFCFWCANGCTTEHDAVTPWSRKSSGQEEDDVMAWAKASVEEILGGQEHQFDMLDALQQEQLSGDVNTVLADIFRTYDVPVTSRPTIIENMVESEDTSSYGVMNAITAAANDPDLGPKQAAQLQRVGGRLAVAAHHRCNECGRLDLTS